MNKFSQIIKYLTKNFYIILAILIVLFIISGFINEKIWIGKMLTRPKYTIAIATTDWHQKNNNGVGTDYSYKINNKVYNETTGFSYRKGDKFLIIYDSLKPKNVQTLALYPVPEDYTGLKIPKNGWKYQEVPFNIDSNVIRKYLTD
ncbi:hypothetical protein SAMN05421664_2118 [Chryseobacterium soldanellicola]|uniref:DUF3592 domain-containing protein n=1 Tax=Chryseobacterium soldanellicola TaxID=311333 RepID=A0A1H1CTH4_9FLAO|nr:hypothetical protein [Chryseobacterium soldanellicola]SDQ67597.1 hypothetical protein SAMN05421664_2118 [Chryseobacterium soldanellicola]